MVRQAASRGIDEGFKWIKAFVDYYKSHGVTIRKIISDSETGFKAAEQQLNAIGIQLIANVPDAHAKVVERAIRSLKDKFRSTLLGLSFKLPIFLHKELLSHVAENINNVPNVSSDGHTPRELLTGEKMDLDHDFKAKFGDCGLFRITEADAKKSDIQSRAEFGLIVGIPCHRQGTVRVFMIHRQSIVRRIKFKLLTMPKEMKSIIEAKYSSDVDVLYDNSEAPSDWFNINPTIQDNESSSNKPADESLSIDESVPVEESLHVDPSHEPRLQEVDHGEAFIAFMKLEGSVRMVNGKLPPGAIDAIRSEVNNLLKYDVFAPLDKNVNAQIIRSLMVIKEKFDARGVFEKWKARLAAMGNMLKTFFKETDDDPGSPTLSQSTIMLLLSLATQLGLDVEAGDVPSAYLQCDRDGPSIGMILDRDVAQVLVEIDPTYKPYVRPDGTLAVLLKKAIYGLPESGKVWYNKLSFFLKEQGFVMCTTDQCLFVKRNGPKFVIIGTHVDDVIIIGNDEEGKNQIKAAFKSKLGVSKFDKNKLSYLKMAINHDPIKGICSVSQAKYIETLLISNNIGNSVAVTPSTKDFFEGEDEPEAPDDKDQFRSTVMSLMYVAKRTRPDILKEVVFLSRKVSRPSLQDHFKLRRVLSYLNGSKERCIHFRRGNGKIVPAVWADASHLVHDDMKGHTGVIIALNEGSGPIYVKSVKQTLIAHSSAEAELIALDEAAMAIQWCRNLLGEIGFKPTTPSIIYQDNQSVIKMAEKGGGSFKRTKHIAKKYFYVHELIDNKDVSLKYLPTAIMIADLLTKPLSGKAFKELSGILLNE
jgi:hypothetical protein